MHDYDFKTMHYILFFKHRKLFTDTVEQILVYLDLFTS